MLRVTFWLLVLGASTGWPPRCAAPDAPLGSLPSPQPSASGSAGGSSARANKPSSVRMEPLDATTTPPVWVLRGEPRGPEKLVFLHGMCGHGLGYAQAFQFSAARFGTLIAPQADVVCGKGPWAKWSGDLVALDARITAAFRALGVPEPLQGVVVLGYSQGATRAEALARRWPQRYTRLVSMAAPRAPSPRGLSLDSAVMMAGSRDRQDLMKAGARALLAAGIPTTYMVIPGATHGAMGPTPEETMGKALAWLFQHSRSE